MPTDCRGQQDERKEAVRGAQGAGGLRTYFVASSSQLQELILQWEDQYQYGHPLKQSTDQPGKVANLGSGQLNRKHIYFPCPRSRLRIWSRETNSAIPYRVSLLLVNTQADSGAYSRDSSRFPRRRPFIYNNQPPSGQSGVCQVTQLRPNGVHCRESAGTGSVVLKVLIVPVTSAAILGITMDQFWRASPFPVAHNE